MAIVVSWINDEAVFQVILTISAVSLVNDKTVCNIVLQISVVSVLSDGTIFVLSFKSV